MNSHINTYNNYYNIYIYKVQSTETFVISLIDGFY